MPEPISVTDALAIVKEASEESYTLWTLAIDASLQSDMHDYCEDDAEKCSKAYRSAIHQVKNRLVSWRLMAARYLKIAKDLELQWDLKDLNPPAVRALEAVKSCKDPGGLTCTR